MADLERKRQKTKEWLAAHPEYRREYNKRWREANPERHKEIQKRSMEKHREKRLAEKRAAYHRDIEKSRERSMESYRKHRDKRTQEFRDRYNANRESEKAKAKEYWKAKVDLFKRFPLLGIAHNAKKRNAPSRSSDARRAEYQPTIKPLLECPKCGLHFIGKGKHQIFCSRKCLNHMSSQYFGTLQRGELLKAKKPLKRAEWFSLMKYFDWRCAYCGKQHEQLCIDHMVPLVRGGTNDISNLVPSCRSCNASKHDLNVLEFTILRPAGIKFPRAKHVKSGYWKRKVVGAQIA